MSNTCTAKPPLKRCLCPIDDVRAPDAECYPKPDLGSHFCLWNAAPQVGYSSLPFANRFALRPLRSVVHSCATARSSRRSGARFCLRGASWDDGRWSGRRRQQRQLGDIHRFVPFVRCSALKYAHLRNFSANSCELRPFSGPDRLRIFIPDEEIDCSGLILHPNQISNSSHHHIAVLAASRPWLYACLRGACQSCPLSEARVSARAFVLPETVGYGALAEAVQETHNGL